MADVTPYGFNTDFEAEVVAHCIFTNKFWVSVGALLEPDALTVRHHKLVLEAVRAIAKDTGRCPGSITLISQRLARWREDQTHNWDDTVPADEWLKSLDPQALPPVDGVTSEVVPVLKRRRHHEVLRDAMTNEADFQKLGKEFSRIETLGEIDTSIGNDFMSFEDDFSSDWKVDQLSTGYEPLTQAMDGGPERGTLSFFFGGAGSGKSSALNMVGVAAAKQPTALNIALATMEIREMPAKLRFVAGLLGRDKRRMKHDAEYRRQAAREVAQLQLKSDFHCKYFPGNKTTTVEQLDDWLKEIEDLKGKPIDLFIVDYADKMGAKADGEYNAMGVVFEGLRNMAIDRFMWLWTAAQAVRRPLKEGEVFGLNDVADSQHKVRVADIVCSVNAGEACPWLPPDQVAFKVCKNREGEIGGGVIGPLPHAHWCGMSLMPVVKDPLEGMASLYEH